MAKTRSRRPSSDTRPARRSLAELGTAMNRAVDEGLQVTQASPATAAPDHVSSTPFPAAAAEHSNAAASRSREPAVSGSAAEMLVQIAKDYQTSVLDGIKASLNAALDHARDFAETRPAGDSAPGKQVRTALVTAAAELHARALESVQANLATSADYARELAGARTAAEFVELAGTQTRKSCELMLKQADVLKSLAEMVTKNRRSD